MRAGNLSLLLSLCIALATGVMPLRECQPTDGCAGGPVAIGLHAHGDGHGHESGDGDAPSGAGCVDAPFNLGVRTNPVTLEAPPTAAQPLPVVVLDASVACGDRVDARLAYDVGVPLGTRSVVLLR